MTASFLLYGSYGYTGRLIVRRAVERGLEPVLSGRNEEALRAQSAETGAPYRAFPLDDSAAVDAGLEGVGVVLHAAGPFSRTSAPMAAACLRTGTHYLDITGEIEVFESLAARDHQARAAGIMLLPGVGFDVVPSDCLAAHLKRRVPSATSLALAIRGTGRLSRGTATTMVENLPRGGRIRRGGALHRVPVAWRTREVDFGAGPVPVTTIPWGDVVTAYHSTGIPNVEVYAAMPTAMRRLLIAGRPFAPLLGLRPIQRALKAAIRRRPPGPTDEQRARAGSRVWGEASDEEGRRAVSRLLGPDGYTITAVAAVAVVEKVLAGRAPAGFRTPSLAYGSDFALEIEGVQREDVL
ncbi:MAG: saccharopine dehydrogenase family protein [Gemmatimonadota bacterium]